MDDELEVIAGPAMKGVSRRNFIKGVIACFERRFSGNSRPAWVTG